MTPNQKWKMPEWAVSLIALFGEIQGRDDSDNLGTLRDEYLYHIASAVKTGLTAMCGGFLGYVTFNG